MLVVDDNAGVRRLLESFLGGIGCKVTSSESVEGARGILERTRFDVALVDVCIPGENSDEFVADSLNGVERVWRITSEPELLIGAAPDVVRNGVLDKARPDQWMPLLEEQLAA